MRFTITAQASPDAKPSNHAPDFDANLFKAYMRFNEAAPTWSAAAWQSRKAN